MEPRYISASTNNLYKTFIVAYVFPTLLLCIINACPEGILVGCGGNGLPTLVLAEYNFAGSDVSTLNRQGVIQSFCEGILIGSTDNSMSTLGLI